jgi:hypothetical protein
MPIAIQNFRAVALAFSLGLTPEVFSLPQDGKILPPAPPPGASRPATPQPAGNLIPGFPVASRPVGGLEGNPVWEAAQEKLRQQAARPVTGQPTPTPGNQPLLPAQTPGNPADPRLHPPVIPMPQVATRPAPGSEPKVVFEKLEFEQGTVDEGKVFNFKVGFENKGPGPLVVTQVVPGCGCTNAGLEVDGRIYVPGDNILPGAKGTVNIIFKTEGFGGVDKHTDVKVYTNDPAIPANQFAEFGCQMIKIHANIVKRFMCDPPGNIIEFGKIDNAQAHEASVTLKSTKNEAFQIIGFEPLDPLIDMRAEAIDSTATAWKVIATIPQGAKFGFMTRPVRVLTKPEAPPTQLTIQAQVHGPVEIDQYSLNFYAVAKGRPSVKTLVVRRCATTTPLKVDGIRLLDPLDNRWRSGGPANEYQLEAKKHLKIDVKEVEKDSVYHVQVVVLETMPVGSFNTILAFSTGIPGAHENGGDEIRIPITGLVK